MIAINRWCWAWFWFIASENMSNDYKQHCVSEYRAERGRIGETCNFWLPPCFSENDKRVWSAPHPKKKKKKPWPSSIKRYNKMTTLTIKRIVQYIRWIVQSARNSLYLRVVDDVDQIMKVGLLREKFWAVGNEVYRTFIDLENYYGKTKGMRRGRCWS